MTNHVLYFLLGLGVLWMLSGSVIAAVDRVARRYNKPGFAVAFFVLGFMTSIGEMAVALNASLRGVPQISAGNLVGASIVIFLLIIPLLAICSKTVEPNHTMRPSNLALTLLIIVLPGFAAIDGTVIMQEGLLILLLYIALIYRVRKKHTFEETVGETVEDVREELTQKHRATLMDLLHIGGAGMMIFIAGSILVEESLYFTTLLGVPVSTVGLLVLSVGTNVPEIIIAIRSVLAKHAEIAFGDYLGSAAANAVLFGLLPLAAGDFRVHQTEFIVGTIVLVAGVLLFAGFGRTQRSLSRWEGITMCTVYAAFVGMQLWIAG